VYGREAPADFVLSEKVTVHRPPFKFNNRFRLLSTLRRLGYLRRTIKRGRYDVLLSFGDRWNNFVMLACLGLDVRVFLSDRSSPELDIGRSQKWLRQLLYPRAAGLLAQTSQAQDMAIRYGLNDRICVVPNPVIAPRPAAESGRQNIVLSVGRMISTRHYDHLIKIFASLNATDWNLIIVGDDSQGQKHRSYLSDLVQSLGVSDRVELAGARADVQSFYDRAKIFAFTSSSEGFPNVVAEAQSSGLPVISYDCVAGPSDLIVDGENGYLIELFDEGAFRKRLGELMGDDDRRIQMSVKARESVALLSVECVASRVLDFMQGREPA
jgi:GalNAc-alpha-(1->4)-GalNAc-alpha-(1->3)-diNAcBac-PP-undecaprenol alpha-1,4-N-acetyl-D-galactosaminyltransferase